MLNEESSVSQSMTWKNAYLKLCVGTLPEVESARKAKDRYLNLARTSMFLRADLGIFRAGSMLRVERFTG
jgi:hypothetical protein